jgi:SAM-dependent methyltransferase
LVISTENGYQLSETARQQAERLWQEHPKSFYTYSEFFVRAPASAAHSRFCEMVYGIDLVQHDMMPIDQLHLLLERLELKPGDRLLELGCGCGRVAAYVAGRTGASVIGVDSVPEAIRQARVFAAAHDGLKLDFIQADMNTMDFPCGSFDAVMMIDSMYFVGDIPGLLQHIKQWVKLGGQMGLSYSCWVGEGGSEMLVSASGNRLGQALKQVGLPFEVVDLSDQEPQHWRKKYAAAASLKEAFAAEGNTFLYNNRFGEARYHMEHVNAGRVRRYLYFIRLPDLPNRMIGHA